MSTVIRFRPDLAGWLVERLNEGRSPSTLVKTMIDERMNPVIAQAIVDAFLNARRAGQPAPTDAVTIEEDRPVFIREPSILDRGRDGARGRLQTDDGTVRVVARGGGANLALLAELMTPSECEELIALARPRLRPSTVVDPQSGANVTATYRNSLGMFFRLAETPFIGRLDRRLSTVMNLPCENGEGLQVLRYDEGGATAAHFDYLQPTNPANAASIARSGQRISTLLVYLNQVEAGGETVFPDAEWSVTPQPGYGVYFESCNGQGHLDRQSFHVGSPVVRGEKWVVTKWMRQRRFVPVGAQG